MSRPRGFTLIELLVLIGIILILIALLVPALEARRRSILRKENETRLRGVHQGCVQCAQSGKQALPGLSWAEEAERPIAGTVRFRLSLLLEFNILPPEFVISPFDPGKTPARMGADGKYLPTITTANFSYAMLDITPGTEREKEWSNYNANSASVAISDRSLAIVPPGDSLKTTSYHVKSTSTSSSAWKGQVVWNDNHVTFEQDGIIPTRYGSGPKLKTTANDDLFIEEDGDGLMCYD